MKTREFIHPVLDEEIYSISGHYLFQKEERLPYKGREVLCLTGYSVTDSSCCGNGGCLFTMVPGFIVEWHSGECDDGSYISIVETITDKLFQEEISKIVKTKEICTQVNFV